MSKKKKVKIKTEAEETPPQEEDRAETGETLETEVMEEGPSEIDQLKQEARDLRDEMLRMRAETENIRKRLQKDKQDCIQFANERLVRELISIFDNLERALATPDTGIENLKEGVKMICDQILTLFKKENVEPITALGEPFDPSVHEVLSQIESPDHEENTVIEEYSKGYRMNGRVLLPARVVTSKKPAHSEPEDKDSDNASTEAEAKA